MSEDWRVFKGEPNGSGGAARLAKLPPPPPWRDLTAARRSGEKYQASPEEVELVNAALYLRRPLLITGPPGTGKSSLAYAIADELGLSTPLMWAINSRSTLADGLYQYDAVARMRDLQERQVARGAGAQVTAAAPDIGRYVRLGPLGTALYAPPRAVDTPPFPRVLLIDELDKSDVDLPNDLLHALEDGRYEVPELVRIAGDAPRVRVLPYGKTDDADRVEVQGGVVQCRTFPIVIMTSNGERDLPPPFLRRCIRLEMKPPEPDRLARIVKAHLGEEDYDQLSAMVVKFAKDAKDKPGSLATDQLLNAAFLLTRERKPDKESWARVLKTVLRELS